MKAKTMTIEQRARLDFEFRVLKRYARTFKMLVSNGDIFVEGVVTTQSGEKYRCRILLPENYPDEAPVIEVIHPRLLSMLNWRENRGVLGSLGLFCLGHPDVNGSLVLRAFTAWHPSKTCAIEIVKIALWCEAYENWRERGGDSVGIA